MISVLSFLFLVFRKSYLFYVCSFGLPMRSIAQRKPIVLLAWSSSINGVCRGLANMPCRSSYHLYIPLIYQQSTLFYHIHKKHLIVITIKEVDDVTSSGNCDGSTFISVTSPIFTRPSYRLQLRL